MNNGWFLLLWGALAMQRLLELSLSRRNRERMLSRGGREAGAEHYPLIVAVHLLFFAATAWEVLVHGAEPPPWWPFPLALFFAAQAFRLWCIRSLGSCWNTRIIVMPGHPEVKRGPYRFLRHPNYLAVMAEILFFPMIFGAYGSMLLLSALNAAVLFFIRIPAEERALAASREAEHAEAE